MNTSTQPFFDSDLLAAWFSRELALVRQRGALSNAEQLWLAKAAHPNARPQGMRMDTFTEPLAARHWAAMLGAVCISEQGTAPVFLISLYYGIERFDDRRALDAWLHQRHASPGSPLELELEAAPRSLFLTLMCNYAFARGRCLEGAAAALGQLAFALWSAPAATRSEGLVEDTFGIAGGHSDARTALERAYEQAFLQDWLQAVSCASGAVQAMLQAWRHGSWQVYSLAFVAAGRTIPLAGAFMASIEGNVARLLYIPELGLKAFENVAALEAFLASLPQGLACIALAEAELWGDKEPRFSFSPCAGPLIVERVASIIALLRSNLAYGLQTPGVEADDLLVRAIDGMDIRITLDRRLAAIDPEGYWTPQINANDFHDFDPEQVPDEIRATLQRLDELRGRRQALTALLPSLGTSAGRLLGPALAVYGEALSASRVWVEHAGGHTQALCDALLARASGLHQAPISLASGRQQAVDSSSVAPAFIEALLGQALESLESFYLTDHRSLSDTFYRLNGRRTCVSNELAKTLQNSLWVEARLQRRLKVLSDAQLARFEAVLECPDPIFRTGPGGQVTWGLQYCAGEGELCVRLYNLFVLQQRGESNGPVLLWTPMQGVEAFETLEALRAELGARLIRLDSQNPWLELFTAQDRQAHLRRNRRQLDTPHLEPWPMRGNLFRVLQHEEDRFRETNARWAFEQARKWHFGPHLMKGFVDRLARADEVGLNLDGLSIYFIEQDVMATLPEWLRGASVGDRSTFIELLHLCVASSGASNGYLFQMPSLRSFASERLSQALARDFPGQGLEPAQMLVEVTRYEGGYGLTGETPSGLGASTGIQRSDLVSEALRHFSTFHHATYRIRLASGKPPPAGLSSSYLVKLVERLDVGAHYLNVLDAELQPRAPRYEERLARFQRQLRAQMLLAALEQKCVGTLSETAYQYLRHLVQMPDGIARQPLGPVALSICPLALIAGEGRAPDRVDGYHLVLPTDPVAGPVVLFRVYAKGPTYQEFATLAHLTDALHSDAELQEAITDRLPAETATVYRHGGFLEPHLKWSTEFDFAGPPVHGPGPVSLTLNPVTGNLWSYLFEDNLRMLKTQARSQSVTSAQARWERFVYLMSMTLEQGAIFLPASLGVWIDLWQARSWGGASLQAARKKEWGRALAELVTALSVLGTSRRPEGQNEHATQAGTPQPNEAGSRPGTPIRAPALTFSWGHGTPSREVLARLEPFEVRTLALTTMTPDTVQGLYHLGADTYAAVDGKVYRVALKEGRWRIVGQGSTDGPMINRTDGLAWRLDLPQGLRGGGGINSKIDSERETLALVEKDMRIEAIGMRQIRAADRIKGAHIAAAHRQAERYLSQALRNLARDEQGRLPPEAQALLDRVFGAQVTRAQSTLVESRMSSLMEGLLDPSLSPADSMRFVTGYNKPERQTTFAFTMQGSAKQEIYLTDRFFRTPEDFILTAQAHREGFDALSHSQGSVLLHELSHLQHDSVDIAYLNVYMPFLDYWTSTDGALHAEVADAQQHALALTTPRDELFCLQLPEGGWRPLSRQDGRAKERILDLTGTRDLDSARDAFYTDADKRFAVILANADSVAYLATQLGRRPFKAP